VYLNCCLIGQKASDFYRGIGDPIVKNSLSNFKLHLARVAISFLTQKSNPSLEEISKVILTQFEQVTFDKVKILVYETIIGYQIANPSANLVNMAKTKQFTDFLSTKVIATF
jgi:hypothetical protein